MTTTIGQRITVIGRRVLAQTAMSATVMTALHFVSVADFPPARWIFGPASAPQASPASVSVAPAADGPAVRVVTLSPGAQAAVTPTGLPAQGPVPASEARQPSDQRIAMVVPTKAQSCGLACTPTPRAVAHPTPRPAAPKILAARPSTRPGPTARAASRDTADGRERVGEPMAVAAGMPDPDGIPMPPVLPEESGFVLADLIPGHRMVVEGVSFVGGQARDVVTGVASGALDLVRR